MAHRLPFIFGLFLISLNISFGQTADTSVTKVSRGSFNQQDRLDSATVYVAFIVETNGKITDIEVTKIKCRKCSKEFKKNLKSEAIRIIKSMPDRNSRNERVKYIQPLKFKLT